MNGKQCYSLPMINLLLKEIETLDWYDGLVRAIGIHEQKQYLLILAAWDIKNHRKAYVLLELDSLNANKMRALTLNFSDEKSKEKQWDSFNTTFDEYLCGFKGVVYLIIGEPTQGQNFSGKVISSSNLSKLINYDIEKVLTDEAVSFWLDSVIL
jgi:hypothetical protein